MYIGRGAVGSQRPAVRKGRRRKLVGFQFKMCVHASMAALITIEPGAFEPVCAEYFKVRCINN
jgi:hypothetical protein